MAGMTQCNTCDEVVSKKATVCPHCGEPDPWQVKLGFSGRLFFFVLMIPVVLFLLWSLVTFGLAFIEGYQMSSR